MPLKVCDDVPLFNPKSRPREEDGHLEFETESVRRESRKLEGDPATATLNRSIKPRKRTLDVRRALYSAALRLAAQRFVRASSRAS